MERRSLNAQLCEKIKVTGNGAVSNYAMPRIPDKVAAGKDGLVAAVPYGGPWGTVPELLFEKKGLIPAVQELLLSYRT